jgi:hypothetical protein
MLGHTLRGDVAFGTTSELNNLETLQNFFQTTLERRGGYSVFDYANPGRTIEVELKTRRINHDTYDSAIIGQNKINYCNNPDVEYWFAYCYMDGVYAIKYDAELFATFERNDSYRRGERADARNNADSIVYIPTNLLRRVDSEGDVNM